MTGKEPLTYYDMNLSAQDHQTFFSVDTQQLRPEDAGQCVGTLAVMHLLLTAENVICMT